VGTESSAQLSSSVHDKDVGDSMSIRFRESPLLKSEGAGSNELLARSFYNELRRGGRSRSDVLDLVNCLVSLLITSAGHQNGRTLTDSIDPVTGFPTRQAFHQMVLHQLDPEGEARTPASVLLIRFRREVSPCDAYLIVRHHLRNSDIVAPLAHGIVGAIVYPRRAEDLGRVFERICDPSILAIASEILEPSTNSKQLWRALRKKLKHVATRTR